MTSTDPTDVLLDKINPDLTQEIENCWQWLTDKGQGGVSPSLRQAEALRKMFMRMYRLGKSHGFEAAMQVIRERQNAEHIVAPTESSAGS